MCHKEAHCFGNLFTPFLMFDLGYVFNRFVGLFHGVLPATFTYSHVYNHHKHHNSAYDVYCTAFRPRDRFTSWLRYIPEWFGYASNVSSILAFMEEGRYRLAIMSSQESGYIFRCLIFLILHSLPESVQVLVYIPSTYRASLFPHHCSIL